MITQCDYIVCVLHKRTRIRCDKTFAVTQSNAERRPQSSTIHLYIYKCMYVCMHVHRSPCMHVLVYIRMYARIYACSHPVQCRKATPEQHHAPIYIYKCMYVCMHVHRSPCMHVPVYIRMYASIYACSHPVQCRKATPEQHHAPTYIHISACMCVCVYKSIYAFIYKSTHTYVRIYICTQSPRPLRMERNTHRTHTHTYIYIYIYIYMCVYICRCIDGKPVCTMQLTKGDDEPL